MCDRVQNYLFCFLIPPVLEVWIMSQAHSLVLVVAHFAEVLGAMHLYK